MLVWKLKENGGVDENPVGEVELNEEDRREAEKAEKFTMKGGVFANPDGGEDTEELVMMHRYENYVKFNRLTQTMNKV